MHHSCDTHHQDEPCDVCGHVGYEEVIATCSKCNIAREHVYCMRVYVRGLPEVWVCEECLQRNELVSPKSAGKDSILDSSDIVRHDSMQSTGPSKVCFDLGKQIHCKRNKAVETGKVKFLSTEEVIRLSSGVSKNGSPSRSNFGLKHGPSNSMASKTVTPKFSFLVKSNRSIVSSGLLKPPRHDDAQRSSMINQQAAKTSKESKEQKSRDTPTKEYGCKEQPVAALIHAKEVKTNNVNVEYSLNKASCASSTSMHRRPIVNAEERVLTTPIKDHVGKEQPVEALIPTIEVETSITKTKKALNKISSTPSPSRLSTPNISLRQNFHSVAEPKRSDVEEREQLDLQYLPAPHATWKGGFKFSNNATPVEFYGGFQAQPSCRVQRKAYEFSQKMPLILQVKLVPCCNLWTDLFQNACPDVHDIALYFFPADNIERSKQNYACLFELIQNSVMISYIDGVELLIFTSKQLHVDSQDVITRSNTKSFLWGVFRSAKNGQILNKVNEDIPSLVSPLECTHDCDPDMDNSEAIDMEIDMVGGRIVGIVDKVISKDSCGGEMDSPPGFEKMSRLNSKSVLCKATYTEEKSCLIEERVTNSVERENIDLPGVSGRDFGPCSLLPQRSVEDCNLQGLPKHQEPARYLANDPLAADPSPLSEKEIRRELKIKVEGNDDKKPIEVGEKKEIGTPFRNEGSAQSTTGSFNSEVSARDKYRYLQAVEIKAEVQKFIYDRDDFSHELHTKSPSKIELPVRWTPPPTGWVKLNTEGCSKGNPGAGRAGGVIRDESGEWVLGYSLFVGTCNSLAADFWALHQGLQLVWDRGYKKVQVESVSSVVVEYLTKAPSACDPNRAMVECCRDLLKRNWNCKVYHIHREANLCANWLATHFEIEDHTGLSGLTIFKSPPPKMVPLLWNDCKGVV